MDKLILRNNGSSILKIQDLGIEVSVGEDLDLIPGFGAEDITESEDFSSLYTQGGEVILTSDGINYNMTYQNVIDYLTPLTRWSKLDYQYISNKDTITDITADELEELTNGSSTTLHDHNGLYYTKTQLQTPNQSQVHWNNIIGVPSGNTQTINGDVYYFDITRNKWLSSSECQFVWTENIIDGKFMSVGNVISFDAGYIVPQDFTITKMTVSSTGHLTKEMQIRINENTVHAFNLSGGRYSSTSLNIDINTGEMIKIFVSGNGNPIKDVVVVIYGKWRTT